MYRFTINNQDMSILSGTLKKEKNVPAQLDVVVTASRFNWEEAENKVARLYEDGALIFEGFVFEQPEPDRGGNSFVVSCLDNLGKLLLDASYPKGAFNQRRGFQIIQTLMYNAPIGNFEDFRRGNRLLFSKLSYDGRRKETLWEQLIDFVNTYNLGVVDLAIDNPTSISPTVRPTIDFPQNEYIAHQGINIIGELTPLKPFQKQYREIFAIGGKIDTGQPIDLSYAENASDYLSDPDSFDYFIFYDVLRDSHQVWNTLLSADESARALSVTKFFPEISLDGTSSPSSGQIEAAAVDLWRAAVAEMKTGVPDTPLQLTVELDEIPRVGGILHVKYKKVFSEVNEFNQPVEGASLMDFDDYFIITKVEMDLTKPRQYKLEASKNGAPTGKQKQLRRQLKRDLWSGTLEGLYPPFWNAGVALLQDGTDSLTYGPSDPADTTVDGHPAKIYKWTLTPTGGTQDQFFVAVLPSTDSRIKFRVMTHPVNQLFMYDYELHVWWQENEHSAPTWPPPSNAQVNIRYVEDKLF